MNEQYDLKIFAKTIEPQAKSQVYEMAKSPLCNGSQIRIMPDVHAGKGCVIGTTMTIHDKICPNIVGVDIGCGVDLIKTNIDFKQRIKELDEVIHKVVPSGRNRHNEEKPYDISLIADIPNYKANARTSLGTLGGGNHFIEAYDNGYIAVHSGSRNIGKQVAEYWQNMAENNIKEKNKFLNKLTSIEPYLREEYIKQNKITVDKALSWLDGKLMSQYLIDMATVQDYAVANRQAMLNNIVDAMGGKTLESITSTHNYIDLDLMILRKGAISAKKNEKLVIPLNMRDGMLICIGKGNADWNYSAPHGCGRLYSRSQAKKIISMEEFEQSMQGIYSTTICQSTIDEAPQTYKDFKEILSIIEPTVDIVERLIPIYNFKAVE